MRVVFDASAVVSAVISPEGPADALLHRAFTGSIQSVTSRRLLNEVEAAFRKRMSVRAAALIDSLVAVSEVIDSGAEPRIARDANDDHVIATAMIGSADFIVTYDHDLLALNRRGHVVPCIEPQRLLDVLQGL